MKIVCDNCSTKYSIADEKVRGKVFKIKCKKCSHIIVVKGTEGEGAADNKETKVFDYSGFEGTGGGGGADAVWHLVVNQEQIGPLSIPDIQKKFETGEVDGDTYAWREGFGDWQRLAAIDELPFKNGAGAKPAGDEKAGLFGGAGGDSAPRGKADPGDLFGGAGSSTDDGGDFQAPVAAAAGGGAPAAARRSLPKEDLFSTGGGGALATDANGGGPAQAAMTGQRNENSVLFSLNNLAALAKPDASPSGGGGGGGGGGGVGGFASGGGSEGSGLIDIRAMAAMTIGQAQKGGDSPKARSGSMDDLPSFAPSSFAAPAAGVLLPQSSGGKDNKMLYMMVGVVGFLALVAIILVVVIVVGKKTPAANPSGQQLAQNSTNTSKTGNNNTTNEPSNNTNSLAAVPSTPSNTVATTGAAPPVPTGTTAAIAAPPSTPTQSHSSNPNPVPSNPNPNPNPTVTPPTPPAPNPNQKCDEVACIVTPTLPCCKHPTTPTNNTPPPDSNLPDKLDQSQLLDGMNAVQGRVMACQSKAPGIGAFKVKVSIASDGSVSNAAADPPLAGSPAEGCVTAAVGHAHFKAFKQSSMTFKMPYKF